MPWFKVDDNLAFHHKVVVAGNAAMGLWVRAGAMCAQQLTDGFVPDHMVAALGGKAQAGRLVTAGLWTRVDGGYQFHEWTERQPTREQVEAERQAARERMANRRKNKGRSSADSSADVQANTDRTSEGVQEPRPDPTRPVVPIGTTDAGKPAKRANQLPIDFIPSDKHEALAEELGVDLRAEWPKFCDHHRAKGSTFKDWDAALRTWIRNARQFSNVRRLPASDDSWMDRRP